MSECAAWTLAATSETEPSVSVAGSSACTSRSVSANTHCCCKSVAPKSSFEARSLAIISLGIGSPVTLCLANNPRTAGSHAKYSKRCEGTSTMSMAHLVPLKCWYWVSDSTECIACPNSCRNVSTSEWLSVAAEPAPKLQTSATAGLCLSGPTPRLHRMTKCAACGNFLGRGSRSR